MIGQSMINVKSGGRTRIAGIAAALFLLVFILVRLASDRTDPAGRAGWRDVHGGDRHLCVELVQHPAQGAADHGRLRHRSGNRRHRDGRPRRGRRGRRDRFGAGLCLEQRQAHPRGHPRLGNRERRQGLRDQGAAVLRLV